MRLLFKMTYASALLAFLSAFTLGTTVQHAEAGIKCKGRYQVNSGNYISTPYCEDNYLAGIARSRGFRVSNRAVRQNPHTKEKICIFLSADSRVNDICSPYIDHGRKSW